MSKIEKLLAKLFSSQSGSNFQFSDLCAILIYFGFKERIRGDHHIFTRDDIAEILNLQPKDGKAKPYQVKQVRTLFFRYKIGDIE